MADRDDLIQRYTDLLDLEIDGDELQAVALVDAAAAPYRTIEPPVSLDRAVERFIRQRRAPAPNGVSIEPGPSEEASNSANPSRLPTRLRTGWLRQGLGMVAAVLAVALLAGVLAVTFRNQGGGQQGGLGGGVTATEAVAVPTPDASGDSSLTFEQIQQIAPFYVAQPTWLPSYLVALGGDTAPHSGPSHPPVAIQSIALYFGPADPNQHFSLEIDESGPGAFVDNPLPLLTTTINGHSISRVVMNGLVRFAWQDQGTDFALTTQMIGPLNEQDVEHMIASMISLDSGTSATPAADTPTPSLVPLSQVDAIWNQVVQTINGGIDPILKPSQLPDGFDTIKLKSITPADGSYQGPPSFDVQYSGQGKTLDIVVGMLAPSLCGSGCTQSQITVRGQQATEQVNDAVEGHISLWWKETGTWNGTVDQRPWIEYYVFSQGLSADEVEQVVGSLEPVSE